MPGERDRPDPSLIINGPRQRRAGPATNRNDNVSKDKDTINVLQRLTQAPGTASRQRSQSVEIEEIPDEDETPANTPPRNDNHLLEHVDDDDDEEDFPIPCQKKARYTAPQKRNRVQSDDDDEPSPSASRPSKRVNAGAELSDTEQDKERGVEKENETDKSTKKGERTWTSPIYAFFKPNPVDTTHDGRPCTEFTCAASHCKSKGKNGRIVRRYLDKKDDTSTKNLRTHAVRCWGEDLVKQAFELGKDWDGIRAGLQNAQMKDGRLTAVFERTGKGKVTYSDRPHTYKEARVECVKWIAESMRPISTVDDPGFHTLMKTGRPHYRIPHSRTVGRDVHEVFKKAKERIKKLLKEYDGQLSFATDAWTGTNGKPFVAVTVHLEHNDESLCLVLDIVEVPVSHSGANLAKAFADILMEFEITNKREFSVAYAAYTPPRAQGTLSRKPKTPWDIDSDSGDESDSSSSSSECENWLGDELERYLAAPRVKGITNPLEWWHANKTTYPRLFRMARDYLNIPATSVAVERLFSRGRLVLSYIRNRLSGETTRALLCLGAWFKLGLIKQKDLEDAASLPDANPNKAAAVDLTL